MKQAEIGSSLYYSVLYVDESKRQLLIAQRELFDDLNKIVFECREPQIATAKLHWWKNELEQTQSQHPLLKILRSSDKECFASIVSALLSDLHTPIYDKQQKLLDFYHQTAGEMERNLGQVYQTQECTENLNYFGIFIQMVKHLRDMRLLLNHGKSYFSGEMLLQHSATLKELAALKMTNNIRQLFIAHCSLANSYFQLAQKNLPISERKKIMPTLILAQIHKTLLDEIERADFPVLQQRITLTPLRKWWISWKIQYLSRYMKS